MKQTIFLLALVMLSCQQSKQTAQATQNKPAPEVFDNEASKDKQLVSLTSTALTKQLNDNLSAANMSQNSFQVKAIVFKEEEKKILGGQEQRALKFDFVIHYVEDYSETKKKGSEEEGQGSILFAEDPNGNWLPSNLEFRFE